MQTTLRWSQNDFSKVQCFQTYWEKSTNSVCIENILIPSCNGRNPCPQDRPFRYKLLRLDFLSSWNARNSGSFKKRSWIPLKCFLMHLIMGLMILFLLWSFPMSVAMRSSLLNYVNWNWEKVECILDDASVGCNCFQEMPACAIDDAFAPVW